MILTRAPLHRMPEEVGVSPTRRPRLLKTSVLMLDDGGSQELLNCPPNSFEPQLPKAEDEHASSKQ